MTKKAIAALTSPPALVDFRDYATARQVAWAIQAVRKDQERIPHGFGAVLSDEKQHSLAQIESIFQRDNHDELRLALPARQDHFVVEELPEFLRAMGEFDSEWFQQTLVQMRIELKK